jgi:ketosteroid isomerase-like protein
MSIDENKRLALRFFETLHKPDVEGAFALMSPDAICWFPGDKPGGTTITGDEMRQAAHASFEAFARRPTVRPTLIAAEGDRVCLELVSRGGRTHRGAAYDNDYFVWLRFRDSFIVEFREYFNPVLAAGLVAEMHATAGRT